MVGGGVGGFGGFGEGGLDESLFLLLCFCHGFLLLTEMCQQCVIIILYILLEMRKRKGKSRQKRKEKEEEGRGGEREGGVEQQVPDIAQH